MHKFGNKVKLYFVRNFVARIEKWLSIQLVSVLFHVFRLAGYSVRLKEILASLMMMIQIIF